MPQTGFVYTMLRRWYLLVVGLVLTVAFVIAGFVLAPVQYSAQASILLLPPAHGGQNPFLGLASVQDVPAAVASGLLSDTAVATLASRHVSGGYSISVDLSSPAPLLIAQATASTPAAALKAMAAVAALVPPTLRQIQLETGVTKRNLIITKKYKIAPKATAVTRTRTRVLFVAIAAGLLLTYLFIAVGDRMLTVRRAKRSHRAQGMSRTQPEDPPARAANGAPQAPRPTRGTPQRPQKPQTARNAKPARAPQSRKSKPAHPSPSR